MRSTRPGRGGRMMSGLGGVPSIAVDSDDNVWAFTRGSPAVQVYAADGLYLRGWREDEPKAASHALKFDGDRNVWLVDAGLHVARKYDPDGRLLLTLGTLGTPGEDESHFNKPTDVAFTSTGDIFISDGYGNNRIVHFDRNGRFVKTWGRLGGAPGEFDVPHAIVCDSSDRLYVADRSNARIQVFDPDGALLAVWPDLLIPWGMWISAADGIWVCGSSPMAWGTDPVFLGVPPKDQLFMKFSTEGKVLQLWTVPIGSEKPGEVVWLHGIALDSKGNVYLGDILGKRLQKFVKR